MLTRLAAFAVAALAAALVTGGARAADTIKIAYTDPLSGTFAQVGDQNLKQMNYIIDWINSKGGALGKKFELVAIDSKMQPNEALLALKSATDQNIPILMHCSGSNIAAALIEGVNKHNERNPDNRIVYVNCGAVATELTNEQCSFWHYRFDVHVAMKAEVMARALPKDVTKVYLMNQLVGDELIPLGKIKDFSPYITKIKASGAQALLTGNWGPDMTLLIKAGMDSGIDLRYYTMYAHLGGGATAIGPQGDGKVRAIEAFNENIAVETGNKDLEAWTKAFRDKHNFDFYAAGFRTIFEFIQAGFNKAGSTDPMKFAQALEGMTLTDMTGHPVTMRADDHQLIAAYYVGVFSKGVKYDSEGTGLGWKTEATIEPKDIEQPTTCKMKRPTA